MKVYALPEEVPAPEMDWNNYDNKKIAQQEKEHMANLKNWAIEHGMRGKNTGRIYREGVADGYAQYMMIEGSTKSFLIHLPYGDAYQSRNAQYIPKKDIIARMDADDRLQALFDKGRNG